MVIQLLSILCILAYVAGIAFLNRRITAPETYARRLWISNVGAVILHGALIALLVNQAGLAQLNFLLVLTIIAWLLGVFSVVRGTQLASLMLRPAIFGFGLLSILLVYLMQAPATTTGVMTPGLLIHIILSLLAFSLLALAALYAGQILYLNRVLKGRSAKALDASLPPLMAVEQYFFRLLTAGTIMLTLAIIAGLLFVDGMFAKGQIHKTILSLLAWFGFGSIVIAHFTRGLRGRLAVVLTLVAAGLLTLAYFGSRFARDVLLS
ncbi:MAG: cytochrome c biogenesis protein CcsA [Idiomarina sp.]|nr:cytochrome c biogenesis protein CcsA [Idiomarina sp.]